MMCKFDVLGGVCVGVCVCWGGVIEWSGKKSSFVDFVLIEGFW